LLKIFEIFHSQNFLLLKNWETSVINHTNVERLAQLIGHEQEYNTTFIYAGEIDLPVLKEAVDKLDYQIDLSHVSYKAFKRKK
jgi:hypothetical protein